MNWLLLLLIVGVASVGGAKEEDLHLTTDDEGYLTVIQGFATQLQCILNTCSPNVQWYKDDQLIFDGTEPVKDHEQKDVKLAHRVDVDYEKGCSGSCSPSSPCPSGSSCVDNQCCACNREDFTLVLKNLTFEDSGRYRCQIANQSEQLEFQVEVLESGLRGGFHENISYDHSACCQEKGISPLCRAMCKPSEMAEHQFDPTSCKTDDYKNFLSCATDNGARSHVHCCQTQLVPSFCYDFCSGNFQMLRRSHRLCLYYLPEIFECYNRAYLPYPDAPEDIQVNALEHDQLSVCWAAPPVHDNNRQFPVSGYTVSYKEIPNFPLFGGEIGLPLLTGDYTDVGDGEDGEYIEDTTAEAPAERLKRDVEGLPSTSVRRTRRTIVITTSDAATNTTSVREYNFHHVNTTSTCLTLSDLRSATRYIIQVTARNDYGSSVPSVRALASTNIQTISNNETAPDALACCEANGVDSACAAKMCKVDQAPTSLETISIATTCRDQWPKVAPCIADQRNHTDCCVRKGVQADCLPICAGSTDPLGAHSVLCLNLDIQAIYQCIREGYESHPSSPVNVSVHSITESSAEISWGEPEDNADQVQTYTLILRRNEHGAHVRQVHNAVSPHTEIGLEPGSQYSVAVRSEGSAGSSLPSTAILFNTQSAAYVVCSIGEPLLVSEGRPFLCSSKNPCPVGYACTDNLGESYCCQKEGSHSDADFQDCCQHLGVSADCQSSCSFNATLPESCKGELNKWVQCASEGQDHSRCCEHHQVDKECLTGCRHPFQVPDSCFSSSLSSLAFCFAGRQQGAAPIAAKNLAVSQIRPDAATITWEHLDPAVNLFTVELFDDASFINATNVTMQSTRLEGLLPDHKYHANVIARSDQGQAAPSWNVSFRTLPESDSEGLTPKQPQGLRITWNYGNRVNVTWNPVTKRRNGEAVQAPIQYTVYYVDSENAKQWTTLKVTHPWAVLSDLHRDALYSVYVTSTEDGRTSRTSSVITLLAQPDSLGLPEPSLTFLPDHEDSVFLAGESITINCSIDVPEGKKQNLNLDLSTGTHTKENQPGSSWVSMEVEADSSLDSASCAVTDTDGRQNVAMKHLLVRFGPVAVMDRVRVRAFDDQSADITCTVKGFPAPDIRFERAGKPVSTKSTRISVKLIKMNTYKATLHIANVTGAADKYTCVAEKNGNKSTSLDAELISSKDLLPVNPHLILSCCEDEHIDGECLQACSIGKVSISGDCSSFASSLFRCAARDAADHRDCCASRAVPKQCLPLCRGEPADPESFDCSSYAVSIMGCAVRGHEGSPTPVSQITYEVISKDKIKVKWEDASHSDMYQYYAVYYKKKDDENDNYKVEKTLSRSIELPLQTGVSYDVGVVSANAFGHSPLVFLDVDGSARDGAKKESGSSFWWIMCLLLLCGLCAFGMLILGRHRELPAPLGKLVGRTPASRNQPSVAFENPAYVSGNEVEIRGLGSGGGGGSSGGAGAGWHEPELRSGAGSDDPASSDGAARHGMRYSKLESNA